jgi:hypothetical protein
VGVSGAGWPALEERRTKSNSMIKIVPVEVLVNGNEAACYFNNKASTPNHTVTPKSIETYHFGDGILHAGYFHNAH